MVTAVKCLDKVVGLATVVWKIKTSKGSVDSDQPRFTTVTIVANCAIECYKNLGYCWEDAGFNWQDYFPCRGTLHSSSRHLADPLMEDLLPASFDQSPNLVLLHVCCLHLSNPSSRRVSVSTISIDYITWLPYPLIPWCRSFNIPSIQNVLSDSPIQRLWLRALNIANCDLITNEPWLWLIYGYVFLCKKYVRSRWGYMRISRFTVWSRMISGGRNHL
jgi:hypothetical protein